MKKTMITRMVSVLFALMLVLGVAACGSGNGDGPSGKSDSDTKVEDGANQEEDSKQEEGKREVTYSFEGAYASNASDFRLDWVVNLYNDGTLEAEPGIVLIDTEEYEAKATATWSETDGVLNFNMENEDGTFTREYELEKDENGGYLFGMEVSLATFVRPIEMRCVTEGFVPAGEAEDSSFN